MKWQNKVYLVGYLGKDPVLKELAGGDTIGVFRLATNSGYSSKGLRKTQWHNIQLPVLNKDEITNHFMKGSHVLIEGSLEYRFFTKQGIAIEKAFINATSIMNLDR